MTSTRAIRQYEHDNNLARCCIVALTGLASATARLEALSSGVDHYMTKPLSFKNLGSLLRKEEERKDQGLCDQEGGKKTRRRESTFSEKQLASPARQQSEHDAKARPHHPDVVLRPQHADTAESQPEAAANESQHTHQGSKSQTEADASASLQDSNQEPEAKADDAELVPEKDIVAEGTETERA